MTAPAGVIDARARFDARRALAAIAASRLDDGAPRKASDLDRFQFHRGLLDARRGVTPSPFAPDAYRRARRLAVELLGQAVVDWQPVTPPAARLQVARRISPA